MSCNVSFATIIKAKLEKDINGYVLASPIIVYCVKSQSLKTHLL